MYVEVIISGTRWCAVISKRILNCILTIQSSESEHLYCKKTLHWLLVLLLSPLQLHIFDSRSTYFVNTDRSLFSLYRYTGSNKTKLNWQIIKITHQNIASINICCEMLFEIKMLHEDSTLITVNISRSRKIDNTAKRRRLIRNQFGKRSLVSSTYVRYKICWKMF